MSTEHFISLDTHCKFSEMVVVTKSGRVTKRLQCATTIPRLVEAIESVRRPRYLTFEEGSLADWLARSLSPHVDELFVCEPRRNSHIAKEGDKDDPIDAEKLAQLYRGGYLKRVHQSSNLERSLFKHHVSLYHDSVRQRVRRANRILAQFRRYGVFIQESAMRTLEQRKELLLRVPSSSLLRQDLLSLWYEYDELVAQKKDFEKRLIQTAMHFEPIRRFIQLPGVSWIRASTFFVYTDTPWRFHGKSALWKYMGVGLDRRHSGSSDTRLHVTQQCNRILKGTITGAANSAITQKKPNPFMKQFEHWIKGGVSLRNARRNVARSLAATLWGMWKNGTEYRPEWVGGALGK